MFCASWMTKFSSISNSPPTSCVVPKRKEKQKRHLGLEKASEDRGEETAEEKLINNANIINDAKTYRSSEIASRCSTRCAVNMFPSDETPRRKSIRYAATQAHVIGKLLTRCNTHRRSCRHTKSRAPTYPPTTITSTPHSSS